MVGLAPRAPGEVVLQRPSQVSTATLLLYGSLGLGVINSSVLWPHSRPAFHGFTLFIQAFTFALLAWLTYNIWRGRNWSRVTFVILWIIGFPFSIPIFLKLFAHSTLTGSISLLQNALQLGALYLLFTQPGRSWFRSSPNNRWRGP